MDFYKHYTTYDMAEEMLADVKIGRYPNRNTAYRILKYIMVEWPGTYASNEAEYLIYTDYSN